MGRRREPLGSDGRGLRRRRPPERVDPDCGYRGCGRCGRRGRHAVCAEDRRNSLVCGSGRRAGAAPGLPAGHGDRRGVQPAADRRLDGGGLPLPQRRLQRLRVDPAGPECEALLLQRQRTDLGYAGKPAGRLERLPPRSGRLDAGQSGNRPRFPGPRSGQRRKRPAPAGQ